MKKINSIINRLKTNKEINPNEKQIVALMLEEMMEREKTVNGELYIVSMSKKMYKYINELIYPPTGDIKPGRYQEMQEIK